MRDHVDMSAETITFRQTAKLFLKMLGFSFFLLALGVIMAYLSITHPELYSGVVRGAAGGLVAGIVLFLTSIFLMVVSIHGIVARPPALSVGSTGFNCYANESGFIHWDDVIGIYTERYGKREQLRVELRKDDDVIIDLHYFENTADEIRRVMENHLEK